MSITSIRIADDVEKPLEMLTRPVGHINELFSPKGDQEFSHSLSDKRSFNATS